MPSTKLQLKDVLVGALLTLVFVAGATFAAVPQAKADAVVFLTRLNQTIATYPASNAFSVGTSTNAAVPGSTAKLSATLGVTDTFAKGLEIASTTGSGTATTTANLLSVGRGGCIQLTSTSSATQIKLQISTLGATSTFNGTAYWNYGTCSP